MKRTTLWIGLGLLLFSSCSNLTETQLQYIDYVNPFVGTGGHGHTFPGPVVPHGMIQPSPDTRIYGWDACSGYHYSDSTINGFSHTHLSGTGCGDYGDVLLMHRRKTKLSLLGIRLPANRLCLNVLALQRSGKTGILFGRTRTLPRDCRTNGYTSGGPSPLSFPRK